MGADQAKYTRSRHVSGLAHFRTRAMPGPEALDQA